MADMIKFFKGAVASLPAAGVNGALYITTDEGAIYFGTGTGMKRLGDFIQVADVASLPAKAHESCLYYCVAENILAKWNGTEWKQINKQPTAAELKTLLGLGSLAYLSEVAEDNLSAALKEKVNAASEGNHSHLNKDVLDDISADKVAAWDAAEANVIETIKVNGTALAATDKAVDISVPTGTLASKDSVSKDDLVADLKAEIEGKLDASEVTGDLLTHNASEFAAASHSHAISEVTGLQDALDGKQAVGDYATKEEAQGYADAKDDAIAAAKQAGDDAASALATYKGEMTTALAGKQDVIPANTYDTYGSAAQALADAKAYADANDADTKYGITYDSANKKIKLVEGGSEVEIDASAFIKDGMINTVTIDGNDDLIITFNTDAGKENIVLPLDQLVDIYTGVEGDRVKVTVSSDNKISADLVAGSISKNYLDTGVQASLSKADSALQAHQDISHLATEADLTLAEGRITALEAIDHEHTNKALLDTYTQTEANLADAVTKKHSHSFVESELNLIKSGDVAKWNAAEQNAKNYADGLAGNYAAADHDHAVEDITDFESAVATKVESYGYATTAYADQAEADAKSYADGLNTAMDTRVKVLEEIDHDAYKAYADQAEADAKSYTDAALTWGEF